MMSGKHGLSKGNDNLRKKALRILMNSEGKWIETAYIAQALEETPTIVRRVLTWHRDNLKSPKYPKVTRRKDSPRVVSWRAVERFSKHGEITIREGTEAPTKENTPSHPDDGLIEGLANLLGGKERYRQSLMKIRDIVNEALSD